MFNKDNVLILLNIYLQQIFENINYRNNYKEFIRIMSYANKFLSENNKFIISTKNVILFKIDAKLPKELIEISRFDNLIFHFEKLKIKLYCCRNVFDISVYKDSYQISHFSIKKTI